MSPFANHCQRVLRHVTTCFGRRNDHYKQLLPIQQLVISESGQSEVNGRWNCAGFWREWRELWDTIKRKIKRKEKLKSEILLNEKRCRMLRELLTCEENGQKTEEA